MPPVLIWTLGAVGTGARLGGQGNGQLGYGNTNSIGDTETQASAGDVEVGGSVLQVAAGGSHTCALLTTGAVRCWGVGANSQSSQEPRGRGLGRARIDRSASE